jgi:hypothetical protein
MASTDRLLELFDAQQVGGVVSDAAKPRGLGVDEDAYFMDPAAAAERAAQTGGRRRKTQRKVGRRRGRGRNRSTFRLNLRAQIRLRSRSQRRH